jgi:hypothetical protein
MEDSVLLLLLYVSGADFSRTYDGHDSRYITGYQGNVPERYYLSGSLYRQSKELSGLCTGKTIDYQGCVQVKPELSGLCTDRFIIIRILSFFP